MRRGELAVVALIMGVAALLRLFWLDSIPAGWHHDEALMGVLAEEVLRGEQRPLFFAAYLGQEPLYIYLGALAMTVLGEGQSILALRLVSALLGIATVGATYLLGRQWFGRRVALVAASLLAISFWHLLFSRDGYRAIAQPLLETLSLYFLWVGVRRRPSAGSGWNSVAFYALAGLSFGGVIYTYLGGRVFPLVLLPLGLWWLVARGLPRREELKGVAIFGGAALLTMAPLALFFLANPDLFWARSSQISPLEMLGTLEGREELVSHLMKTLGMFTQAGDPLWRFNISGRPIFSWFWAPFFYLGLAGVVWRAWRRQAAAAMLLSWLLVMVAPTALAYEKELVPNSIRSLGLIGAIYLVPALGMVDVGGWLGRRLRGKGWQVVGFAGTGLLLLAEGALNTDAYFGLWAHHLGTAIETGEDMVAAARYLEGEAATTPIRGFISSDMYPHPVVKQLAPLAYPNLRWFDGRQSLVLPQTDQAQTYVFPYLARNDALVSLLTAQAQVAEEFFPEGPAKFVAFRLSPEELAALRNHLLADPSFHRIAADLGSEVELLAYNLGPRVEAGGKLPLTLVWRVPRPPKADSPRDYVFFSHLIDRQGQSWGVGDVNGFPVTEWRPGDLVIGRYDIKVKEDAPNGAYQVWVGVYDRKTMERLPLPDGALGLNLGRVRVIGLPTEEAAVAHPTAVSFQDNITLVGSDLKQGGKQLEVTLYWRAAPPPRGDYTVFVHLLDANGKLVAQHDSPPAQGQLPTSLWLPNELVADTHPLTLTSLPTGRYQIAVGLYLLESGQRLSTREGKDYVSLSSLELALGP